MCGIVGLLGGFSKDAAERIIAQMNGTIFHRGPDDEGAWAEDGFAFAMRRLSIIDLALGRQPIASEDGSKQIVFNGEIYNFRDLRPQLAAQGHTFSTASDTEVILHQYEQDGPDCVKRLNGMFAFAIWDRVEGRLFLARDRMGVKPLYYYWDGRNFLFASEIKALLASELVPREINLQALWDYLTFRYVPQPETIWQKVYKLLPGHTLSFSTDRPEPVIRRYWDIPYADGARVKCQEEYEEEFTNLFLDAVRLRLIADVPVGVLLSGGLDSSSVAAAISEVHNAKLNSFSVAFQDSPATDERPFARQVAERVGMDHSEIVIGEREVRDFLPRLVYYTDEPLADLASIPLYYVSHLAREKVKVVLSGEGSDEILGGYHLGETVRSWDRLRQFQRLPRWLRRDVASGLARILGERWVKRVQRANVPLDQALAANPINMTNYLSSAAKQTLFNQNAPQQESMAKVQAVLEHLHTREPLHQLLYIYCQSWLVEDLLMKADKMTMANSLELRVPFLDYRLVEWAAQAPPWVKVGRNGLGGYETKRVLRNFARTRLPAEIITRSKQGFPVPLYDWLTTRLRALATELLASPDTRLYCWLRPAEVRKQLQLGTDPTGTITDKHRLWNLLILELWLRQWHQ